tara:strand:- start:20 stop:676 length:657 start_codon:yes stop_codon:yes gene_type:complete
MYNSDIKNLFQRIISAVIFIPIIILPIIYEGYILYLTYIFLLSLITLELFNLLENSKKRILISLYLLICIFTFFIFIISILSIEHINLNVIEILLTLWIFDTFCYLGGKIFKGKKLMPKISKGKTFNGLFSGIIATLIISFFYYLIVYNSYYMLFLTTIPTIIFSFFGDLFVSVLKRSANVKDSGNIVPGHGGILDRMDSFIMVFFFFGIYLLIFLNR